MQEDTQYQPDLTVQKYNKVKSEVVTFAQVLGTRDHARDRAPAAADDG